MPDDPDDDITPEQIINAKPLFDDEAEDDKVFHAEPIFEAKYMGHRNAPQEAISSRADVVKYFNEYSYWKITIRNKFKVMKVHNGEINFLDQRDFIAENQHLELSISDSDGSNTRMVPFSRIWLKSQLANELQKVVFDPNPHYVAQPGVYNVFDGYKIKPRKGDVAPFHDLMKVAISSGNEKSFVYLDALIAQMFQEPHDKPGVAVVIRGDEGVGKSFFMEKISYLMRPYYLKTSNPSYIFGDHNGALINKMLLHLEEAMWAGSKKDEAKFKDTISGPTLEINEKFQPMLVIDNHLHLFLTGNPDWLVKVGFNSRRIFALHASNIYMRDTDYFGKLHNWFHKEGGAEALMYYWMNLDWRAALAGIGVKDIRIVPITEELIKQRKRSQTGLEKWAINCNEEGHYPYGDVKDGKLHVIKRLMVHAYNNSPEGRYEQLSSNEFGDKFCALFPKIINGEIQRYEGNRKIISVIETGENIKIKDCNGKWQYAYIIPLLAESRGALDFTLSSGSDVRNDWKDKVEWTTFEGNNSRDIMDIRDKTKPI